MERLNRKILMLAIGMALVTSMLLYLYISRLDTGVSNVEYVEVYAAKVEIPARTVIKEEMLVKVKLPRDTQITMGVSDKSKLVGKLTKERIIKGEPVLADRIAYEEKTNMAFLVPKGKRALTIGVNEIVEVGNFIIPGDYVDILATFDEAQTDVNGKKIFYPKYTKTILQNIQILGVGQSMQAAAAKEEKGLPVSVTLAVTLEEAEKLVLADESGVLRLALKPVADNSSVQTNGALKDDMVVPRGKIEN